MKITLNAKEHETLEELFSELDSSFENLNTFIDDDHTDNPDHHMNILNDLYSEFRTKLDEWKETNVFVKGLIKYKHDHATELMIETISEFDISVLSEDEPDIAMEIYDIVCEINSDPFATTAEKLRHVKRNVIETLYEKVISTGFEYTPTI